MECYLLYKQKNPKIQYRIFCFGSGQRLTIIDSKVFIMPLSVNAKREKKTLMEFRRKKNSTSTIDS